MAAKITIPNGSVFSRLTVVREAEPYVKPSGRQEARSWCKCICGKELSVINYCLRSGHTTSCGCFRDEVQGSGRRTHGQSGSPEYDVWMAMRMRCENPKNKRWDDYGGRGISVCERWKVYENFIADMGHRPSSLHTIERSENDGNYEPGNCVWATKTAQARNKRNTRFVTLHGITKTLMEWCCEYGIDYYVVHGRLREDWTPEDALATPVKRKVSA